ncbi:MAG TPA: zinc-ribbon domain-containing protein, partial [Anaeromyxobacteraceae bacterium]
MLRSATFRIVVRIACPSCRAEYEVDDARIPAAGLNVRCPRCQAAFPVRPPAAVPSAPGAVPLPPAPRAASPGGTMAYGSPPPTPPPEAPAPPAAPAGSTMSFDSPFAAAAPAAAAPEGAAGGTMEFASPLAGEQWPREAPPAGSVPLPAPEGRSAPPAAAPVAPLGFGEVELPGGEVPAPVAFDAEPLPAAPDLPPPADPFVEASPGEPAGLPAPFDPFPPAAAAGAAAAPVAAAAFPTPPPLAAEAPPDTGPSAQELEALFEEGGVTGRASRRPAPSGPGWRVRRRSGKVFGPFQEADVVEMLGRGELLGNEEVTRDERNWTSIGEVPAFGQAIRRLIDRPVASDEGARRGAPLVPFGTRVSVAAPEAAPAPRSMLARLPRGVRVALPAVAGAAALAAGLGAGFSDYGIFFHRLLRGQVGPNRPGARLLDQARQRFAEDAWPGAQAALGLADQAVRLSSADREAKGVYAQVAFWMARRTGAPREAQGRARAFVAEIAKRDPRAADTLKARVSAAVAEGAPPAGVELELERWLAKAPRDQDAAFLLGELALQRGEVARAEGFFQRLEQQGPGGARAAHALGLAAAARGDAGAAAERFEEALRRDPAHLASALELAEVAVRAADL